MSAIDKDSLKLLNALILSAIQKYEHTHYVRPNYVKVPQWVLPLMRTTNDYVVVRKTEGSLAKDKYMGLMVCPTISTESIYDIEVF
jgi:hypothetical protein